MPGLLEKLVAHKDRLAFGLIVLFAVSSMVVVSWVISSFLALQSLSTVTSRYAETWNSIAETAEYMSTRTEVGTLSVVAITGLQRRLSELLEEESAIIDELDALLRRANLFWAMAGLDVQQIAEVRATMVDQSLISWLREAATASPESVHSSLAFWPMEMAVSLRTQSNRLLSARRGLLGPTLPKALDVFWWLLAFVFAILILAILAIWLFLMAPALRSLHATEDRLRVQRSELQLVVDNVPALICRIDRDMRIQTVNETLQTQFAHLGELQRRHVRDILGEVNWARVAPGFHAALDGEPRSFDLELGSDGAIKTFQMNLVPELVAVDGPVSRVYVTLVDIEERIETERILRRSQQNLSTILNSIGDGLIAFDDDMRITQFNQVAEKLTGQNRADAEGRPVAEVVSFLNPDNGSEFAFAALLEQVKRDEEYTHLELQMVPRTRDSVISIACSFAPILDRRGERNGAVIVFRDISGEKMLRERAHHNDKMNAIGQLAGGIAHDFNNMLGGILAQLELLKLQHSEMLPSRAIHAIDSMLRTVDRAGKLTRSLTAFARVDTLDYRPLDLSVLVSDTLRLVRETADRRITFSFAQPTDTIQVNGSESALQAVVLNIMINGVQAMRDGGTLSVEMRRETVEDALHLGQAFHIAAGDYAVIAISDSGSGMSDIALERLYEPFFTTKQATGGTGLGLAAAYGVLGDHNGGARVSSRVGEGSTFELFLPIASDADTSSRPLVSDRPVRNATVLLVDDEEGLRNTIALFLERKGSRVVQADDGHTAISVFDSQVDAIDLCVLDVNLPGLSGYEVYQHIKDVSPGCAVVFATGFNSEEKLRDLLKMGIPLLQKPYRLHEISTIIATELARAKDGSAG